jgi:hypothetical protein
LGMEVGAEGGREGGVGGREGGREMHMHACEQPHTRTD